MLNLLYTEAMRDNCPALPTASVLQDGQTTIYWYGKPAGIIGRKMGHINTLAADVASAVQVANRTLAELSNSNQENAVWVQ